MCTQPHLICIHIVHIPKADSHANTQTQTHRRHTSPYEPTYENLSMCAYCYHILSHVCVSRCIHTCKAIYTYQCVHRIAICMYICIVICKQTHVCSAHAYTHTGNSLSCKDVATFQLHLCVQCVCRHLDCDVPVMHTGMQAGHTCTREVEAHTAGPHLTVEAKAMRVEMAGGPQEAEVSAAGRAAAGGEGALRLGASLSPHALLISLTPAGEAFAGR